jgi:hypothetical protein
MRMHLRIVINPVIYGLCPALVLLAVNGCRDEHPRRGESVSRVSAGELTQTDTATRPADVIRRYYDAIRNGQYDTAYALWEGSGRASGLTRAGFAKGFAQTERITATIGDSVRVEGAAGSQYATVPVTIDAVLRGGTRQHFVGTYTLRRAMVDGATPEQRSWRIYSGSLRQH